MSIKLLRAIKQFGKSGHTGSATVAHVQRNIESIWADAITVLTGKQYGQLMEVANKSYHDGAATATQNGDVWDYNNPTDWVAGVGTRESDGRGGYRNPATVEVTAQTVTITTVDGKVIKYNRA